MAPDTQFQETRLRSVLQELKEQDVNDGAPFEVLDGDLLFLDRELLGQLFKDKKDEFIVISVAGPQSAGKSTLLNYLFGCDFKTSQGRTTKGVYGTLIHFSAENENSGPKGVLILDTEGIFSAADLESRFRTKHFDLQIITFCLAVSDFLVLVTRGDVSQNMKDALVDGFKSALKVVRNIAPDRMGVALGGLADIQIILNSNNNEMSREQIEDINAL